MMYASLSRRHSPLRTLATLAAMGSLLMTTAPFAFAQTTAPSTGEVDTVRIRMRPHCEKLSMTECPQYAVKDPVTLETPILVPGSILDIDIMIENPKALPIRRARAWISYDPSVLEGTKVDIGKNFPVVTPGEADFNGAQGYVQIDVSAEGTTEARDPLIPIVRVQFLVKAVPQGGKTVLSYFDVQPGLTGHTFVTRSDASGQAEENVLHPAVGTLIVRAEAPATPVSSASSSTSVPMQASSSVSPVPSLPPYTSSLAAGQSSQVASVAPVATVSSSASSATSNTGVGSEQSSAREDSGRSTFVLLQTQNLRLTTEGSTVYLAWDHLRSSELQGYNVYYGAESGRYLQRRSVAKDSNTLAVRALPLDTTYYFAVRAVNGRNEESAFSQEVAVKVGNPATSTAPLAQIFQDNGPQGKNPIDGGNLPSGTPGATGLSSTILLVILASAVIGTLFAFRRQLSAVSHLPR